ncbi:hypothetical protein KW782_02230 [Candidatus Parcubacteria bacterium]|nr:hypothetical protein [Candidatus Parcubacteria bacterium]
MNKRYWLRGGIIGGIFSAVIILLGFIMDSPYNEFLIILGKPGEVIGKFIADLSGTCLTPAGGTDYLGCAGLYLAASVIAYLVFYILVGVVLGWLYGKIRNRNAS